MLKPFDLKNRGYPSINVSQVGKDGLAVRYSSNGQQLCEGDDNRDIKHPDNSLFWEMITLSFKDFNIYTEKIQINHFYQISCRPFHPFWQLSVKFPKMEFLL